ncbi:MAG: carboxypeptidase regulatory-like domain-containing protein [Acidobacteriota bacterium]
MVRHNLGSVAGERTRGLWPIRKPVCFLLMTFTFFTLALARESAIEGVVTDSTKGVIPGAEITVTNLDTLVVRKAVTNDAGFYSVQLLKEGRYRVECALTGFKTSKTELLLDTGQVAKIDFELTVGEVSEVVEVTATAARIQQQPHNVGTVIEEKQIHELPLDGRNYLTLANLSPGILIGGVGGRGEQTAAEGGFRSGGLAMDQTAILVDGVDNAARTVQGPLVTQAQTMKPPPEAISQFKVVTNNVSAEYGYKAGAQVLVSTKGGTNEFHGSLYEFHRNNATSANNFMFNRDSIRDENGNIISPRPPFIRNQFGGTIGGPIVKDKTFFFASIQGTRIVSAGDSYLSSVPSAEARKGNFANEMDIGNGHPNIYDPLTLTGAGTPGAIRQQFPNNQIPANRMDPVYLKYIDTVIPLPNVPGREYNNLNYFYVSRNSAKGEVYDGRIDHNFNDNHRTFFRYSYRHDNNVNGGQMEFPARADNYLRYTGHQIAGNYNMTINPRMTNELRGGWTHLPAYRDDNHTENLNEKIGLKGAGVDQFPELAAYKYGVAYTFFGNRYTNVGGGSAGGNNKTVLDTYYLAENFLMERGKHSLRFGGEYRRWRSNRKQGNIFGTLNFDGRYTAQKPNQPASRNATGNPLADALLGWLCSTDNGVQQGEDIYNPFWGVYAQDDWKVTPRLTINIGLRWELYGQPRVARFDETTPVARPTFIGNMADETSPTLDLVFDQWVVPSGVGDSQAILDKDNFAPRLGIAYRIFKDTVIRAGGGLYYSENGTVQLEATRFNVGGPNIVALSTPQGYETTDIRVVDGFPALSVAGGDMYTLAGPNVVFVPPLLKTINSAQWFLDIQHQLPWDILLTVGYNGQAQSHLHWWNRNIGAPLEPHGTLAWNNPARLRSKLPADFHSKQRIQGIFVNDNNLSGNYNAFTAKAEKRFSRGLSFLNSFTWSKALDYGISSLNERGEGVTAGAGGKPPSQYMKDIWMNYGPSGLSRDFAYNASFLYELPFGSTKGLLRSGPLNWVFGDWQMGGIFSIQSGPWVSHSMNVNYTNTYGPYRGNLVGKVNLPKNQRDSMRWFDDTAIVAGEPGVYGNAGRGLIQAPGWKNVDFLLSKNFSMPFEGHHLQFRYEVFNLTNNAHLGAPSINAVLTSIVIGNPQSTRIITGGPPRQMQFALKYLF